MKKLIIAFGAFLAFVAAVVAAALLFTGGLATTANQFFAHIKNNENSEAWQLMSTGFREEFDRETLLRFLEAQQLTDVVDTTWNFRSFTGRDGLVRGTAATAAGRTIPLEIDLIKESDGWKIRHFDVNRPGLSTEGEATAPVEGSSAGTPPEAEQVELVKGTLTAFAQSVDAGNFAPFYADVADLWKRQGITVEQLNEAFRAFIDHEVDIRPMLASNTPTFDSQSVLTDDGILEIRGHFPASPDSLHFRIGYAEENGSWKPVRTAVSVE